MQRSDRSPPRGGCCLRVLPGWGRAPTQVSMTCCTLPSAKQIATVKRPHCQPNQARFGKPRPSIRTPDRPSKTPTGCDNMYRSGNPSCPLTGSQVVKDRDPNAHKSRNQRQHLRVDCSLDRHVQQKTDTQLVSLHHSKAGECIVQRL